jgi:predicted transposase/invertase (TIGR01784 family)
MNPKVDIVFKKIFGSEENKDILKSFINSVLSKDEQISELVLKNPYSISDYKNGKMTILDIKATDEKVVYMILRYR